MYGGMTVKGEWERRERREGRWREEKERKEREREKERKREREKENETHLVTCVLMLYCRVLIDWHTSMQPRYYRQQRRAA